MLSVPLAPAIQSVAPLAETGTTYSWEMVAIVAISGAVILITAYLALSGSSGGSD